MGKYTRYEKLERLLIQVSNAVQLLLKESDRRQFAEIIEESAVDLFRIEKQRPPTERASSEILAEMRRHYDSWRGDMTRPELGYWLVEIGRLQVELAEALVREAKG